MANNLPLTKEAILDTAEQVLRRYGPEKTSVVDVARALQVSHGTIYRHFPSKAALREATTERWLKNQISEPLEQIAKQSTESASDQLRKWFETLVQCKRKFAKEDPEMFAMYTDVTLEAVDMITTHVNNLIIQISGIMEKGMQQEEFRTGQPDQMARALFSATTRFHNPVHAYEWSLSSIDEEFDSVWNLLLLGIKKQHK